MAHDIVDYFAESLYVEKFSGSCFVIKIGGSTLANKRAMDYFAQDKKIAGSALWLYYKRAMDYFAQDLYALTSIGAYPVIVHGGGSQITQLSKELGFEEPEFDDGIRITDEESLEAAKLVFGKISTDLISKLKEYGVESVGNLSLNALHARKKRGNRDYKYTGEVKGVDPTLPQTLAENGYVSILSSLGQDEEGTVYNINADLVASEVAISLEAEKLIYMTNTPGILEDVNNPESLIPYLTIEEAENMLKNGAVESGMRVKLESAIHAVKEGVKRVTILNGKEEHALQKEIFTKQGLGTMLMRKAEKERYLEEG